VRIWIKIFLFNNIAFEKSTSRIISFITIPDTSNSILESNSVFMDKAIFVCVCVCVCVFAATCFPLARSEHCWCTARPETETLVPGYTIVIKFFLKNSVVVISGRKNEFFFPVRYLAISHTFTRNQHNSVHPITRTTWVIKDDHSDQ